MMMYPINRASLTGAVAATLLSLLTGCATSPVAEELVEVSPPIATIEDRPVRQDLPLISLYYAAMPQRQYLRGANETAFRRFELREARPAAVAERVGDSTRITPISGPPERVLTETYGIWQ